MAKRIEDLNEALDAYCEQESIHRMDNPRTLTKIVQVIGYNDSFRDHLDQFFEDNPGACEAVYNWIAEQNNREWRDAVVSQLHIEDDDASEDEDESNET